ncbi:MAG: hypothetical protein A3J88_02760 [Melioribacter sp. RIFOXYB12_FULL_38_5]|nr:MAG: hypothetical protein A3J88_02760 [Melioribacter sp. RIFOXYB12_FULL_38_5]
MIDTLLIWLEGLPSELIAFVLAAIPVTETRLALPVAIFVLHLSPWVAFVSTLLGNLFPRITTVMNPSKGRKRMATDKLISKLSLMT